MTTPKLGVDASLTDVAALSAREAWAVGQQDVWNLWTSRSVITHWNGTAWTQISVRDDPNGSGNLRSVAVVSPHEVWAVGTGHDGLPYVVKGDVNGFDRISGPPLRSGVQLAAVAASGGRVTTAGVRDGRAFVATFAAGKWTLGVGPDGASLYGVALTPKDGWAVGDDGNRPLIMHQSGGGGGWKTVKLPAVDGGYLRDVYAQGAKHVVAVGGVYSGGSIAPLIFTWDGKDWTRAALPIQKAELYGVTGDGQGRYWASGFDPAHAAQPFLLVYDGKRWSVLRGTQPEAGDKAVRLQSVTRAGQLTMAVGHVLDARGDYSDFVEGFGLDATP
ncbi:hypothetical protein J5X84_05735 [Streptosporangiaceae bacterium NEAU-GS5]|nr:hypothetical protein [Streptosporangiaceae bacterium NEAU-GS5]